MIQKSSLPEILRIVSKALTPNIGRSVIGWLSKLLHKLAGVAGNLAIILHVARDPANTARPVDDETLAPVERIVCEFLIPHAEIFFDAGRFAVGRELMRAAASYLLTSGKQAFTPSDLTVNVSGLRGFDLFKLKNAMSTLIAGGWLTLDEPTPSKPRWTLRPGVAARMADRRDEENARKLALRRLMHDRNVAKA
jgi:hypothetical protein